METPVIVTPPTYRKTIRNVILALLGAICLLVSFQVGIFVGYRKAAFSFSWSDNYHRMFAGPKRGFFNDDPGFIPPHGVFGVVVNTDGSTIVVKGDDNIERSILISSTTAIVENHQAVKASDIEPNERVAVIGAPNPQGQVNAQLIRIFEAQ